MSAVIGEKNSPTKKKGRKIMENLKLKMEQEKEAAIEQKSPRSGAPSQMSGSRR